MGTWTERMGRTLATAPWTRRLGRCAVSPSLTHTTLTHTTRTTLRLNRRATQPTLLLPHRLYSVFADSLAAICVACCPRRFRSRAHGPSFPPHHSPASGATFTTSAPSMLSTLASPLLTRSNDYECLMLPLPPLLRLQGLEPVNRPPHPPPPLLRLQIAHSKAAAASTAPSYGIARGRGCLT